MADQQFKTALMSAASGALSAGTISRHDHDTLQAVVQSPNLTFATALQYLVAHSIGAIPSAAGAIDWISLVQAIQMILPFIMQIVALFKPQPAPVPPPAPAVTSGATQGSAP